MANEFRNLQPNKYGKMVSDALRKGQETGNYLRGYGVGHLGDLFLGDAADVAEDMSYGRMPFTGSGMTTQIKPGAVDLAGYAGGAGAIAKGLVKGGMNQVGNMANSLRNLPLNTPRGNTARQRANRSSSDLFNTRTDMMMDPSRREALKTMGKGAAVGTAAMSMPLAMKAGAKMIGKGAAPAVAKAGNEMVQRLKTEGLENYISMRSGFDVSDVVNMSGGEITRIYDDIIDTYTKRYGDEFAEEGFSDRMNIADGVKPNATGEDTGKLMARDDADLLINDWVATGKSPKELDMNKVSFEDYHNQADNLTSGYTRSNPTAELFDNLMDAEESLAPGYNLTLDTYRTMKNYNK